MDNSDFHRLASEMINSDFGNTAITLRVTGKGTYIDGEYITTTTDYSSIGCVINYPTINSGESVEDNSQIKDDDFKLLMLPISKVNIGMQEPLFSANNSVILIGSVEFKVSNVKRHSTNYSDVIYYEIHMRR